MSAPETAQPIRPELLARLEALRPALEANCCVQYRQDKDRRAHWRLRCWEELPDGRKHRSLRLRDEEEAMAAREMVSRWRQESKVAASQGLPAAGAKLAPDDTKAQHLARMRGMVVAAAGGGRLRRRRMSKAFDEAASQGHEALCAFFTCEMWNMRARRGGRPRKSGLC